MERTALTKNDRDEVYTHVAYNAPFGALTTLAAGLNYLEQLKRTFSDSQLPWSKRTPALHRWLGLEPRLYGYVREETPLSIFDADYKSELNQYFRLRLIFLDAADCTFMRHRLHFLLELIHVCYHDDCDLLPGRQILTEQLEKRLFDDYLLYDMNLENTQFVGREAVSNGYHECDFTLEIEDIMKEPHKAIPRRRFRYLLRSLPESRLAQCAARWLYEHRTELRLGRWIVDEAAIWDMYLRQAGTPLSETELAALKITYQNETNP